MLTFAVSETGLVRKKNEDRYVIRDMDGDSIFLAVADGMGGAAAGEVAAEMALDRIGRIKLDATDYAGHLSLLARAADRAIVLQADKDPNLEGMGTTLTGILIANDAGHWIHVGDSRLYHLRDGQLVWQTRDQSIVQSLLDEGEITEEEAANHPARNFMDQCVGCGHCEPDAGRLSLRRGDLIMLSTDGLHGAVDDATMTEVLSLDADIETKADELAGRALAAGGKDNITLVLAQL